MKLEQIEAVSHFVSKNYKAPFWIMAYTGMDVSDVLDLRPLHFNDGWISKKRGKSGIDIEVPVCDPLSDILKTVPWPIQDDAKIFPSLSAKTYRFISGVVLIRLVCRGTVPSIYGGSSVRFFWTKVIPRIDRESFSPCKRVQSHPKIHRSL